MNLPENFQLSTKKCH